jgi:hypothetical protein
MAWVAEPSNQVILHIEDFSGKHAQMVFYTSNVETDPDAGFPADIAAATQAITTGLVTDVEVLIHAIQTSPGTPATGPYDRVQDKAKFVFLAADGSQPVMQVPGPLATIFKSDTINIDPTDTLALAFINAVKANCVTAEGEAIIGLQRGFRREPSGLVNK